MLLPSEFKHYLGSEVTWACQCPKPTNICYSFCVYMCVYGMYECIYVYMHVCTCLYVCTSICMYACTCVHECMHMLVNSMHVVHAWTRRSEVDVRCLPLLLSTQCLETVFLWTCKCWSSDGKVFWQSGAKEYHKVTVSIAAYSSAPGKGFPAVNSSAW